MSTPEENDLPEGESQERSDSDVIQIFARNMHNALLQGNDHAWAARFGYTIDTTTDTSGAAVIVTEKSPAFGFRRLVLDTTTLIEEGERFLPQSPLNDSMGEVLAKHALEAKPGDWLSANAANSGWKEALNQLNGGQVFVKTHVEDPGSVPSGQEPLVLVAMIFADGVPIDAAQASSGKMKLSRVSAMYGVGRRANPYDFTHPLVLGQAVLSRDSAIKTFGSDTVSPVELLRDLQAHAFGVRRNGVDWAETNSPWRIVYPEKPQPHNGITIQVPPPGGRSGPAVRFRR